MYIQCTYHSLCAHYILSLIFCVHTLRATFLYCPYNVQYIISMLTIWNTMYRILMFPHKLKYIDGYHWHHNTIPYYVFGFIFLSCTLPILIFFSRTLSLFVFILWTLSVLGICCAFPVLFFFPRAVKSSSPLSYLDFFYDFCAVF